MEIIRIYFRSLSIQSPAISAKDFDGVSFDLESITDQGPNFALLDLVTKWSLDLFETFTWDKISDKNFMSKRYFFITCSFSGLVFECWPVISKESFLWRGFVCSIFTTIVVGIFNKRIRSPKNSHWWRDRPFYETGEIISGIVWFRWVWWWRFQGTLKILRLESRTLVSNYLGFNLLQGTWNKFSCIVWGTEFRKLFNIFIRLKDRV